MWFVIGFLLGIGGSRAYRIYLRRRSPRHSDEDVESMLPVNRIRNRQKEENLKAVLRLLRRQPTVRNQDVQDLLEVSPKTARNYFDELEEDGLVTQHGVTGRDVYYVLNR